MFVVRAEDNTQWTQSLDRWLSIDAHVILFVIVPALIFTDAFYLDFHLFRRVFGQSLWLAGPGVIAGELDSAALQTCRR